MVNIIILFKKKQMVEKSRIYFIKDSVDKYKNFICQYNKYINDLL